MRTIRVAAAAAGALALLAVHASAQTRPAAILNVLEVQILTGSTEPDDHARLSFHFAALADRYAATAQRQMEQAGLSAVQANRGAVESSLYYRHLAGLNAKSAATVRALATHHERLAAGLESSAPPESARFQAGEGAPAPTDRELDILAAWARTPSEHGVLQEYYLTLASRHTATAVAHMAMALNYRGTRIAQAADHCERIAASSRDAARQATAMATLHRAFSGGGE